MRSMLCCDLLPVVNLCHPPHSPTAESWILVAVPPAVYGALNQTALASKAWVELGQSPTNGVTLCFVVQSVAFVLIFRAARSRVDAILSLEVLRQAVHVHRLNVTSNSVFHLDAVARVFERDPLDTVPVLSNYQRCCRRDRTRRCVCVDSRARRRRTVKTLPASGRAGWCRGCRAHASAVPLELIRW
jgi:hypothetical protein